MNKGRRTVSLLIAMLLCLQMIPVIIATDYQNLSEAADRSSAAVSGDIFVEVTNSITFQYRNGTNWNNFSSTTEKNAIDAVRIVTGDKPYRFLYKTKHEGTNWQGSVQSISNTAYAGLDGTAMTNLAIEVYEGPRRIYDNYVVMYRAMVADEWLDWVSNGQPPVMRSIQEQFHLPGNLDTAATDAGWSTRGNIQGLEIRIFERIDDGYTGPIETDAFQETDDVGIQYYKNGAWHGKDETGLTGYVEGVRLQTKRGKPYYLFYRAKNPSSSYGENWLSFVFSDNNGEHDYAGLYGHPMSHLEIRVYTQGGQRIYDDFVVMYRARVTGMGWLAWASNGQPEVMESIQAQFGLDGKLDKGTTNAGWSTNEKIEEVEIRVFERKGSIAQPSENAKIINAPYIYQNGVGLPNGCESVSTVMALQYLGVEIDCEQFVTHYLDMGPAPSGGRGSDPRKVYVGDPHKTNGLGWGCYAPVIVNAVNEIADREQLQVTELSGRSLGELCSAYINNDIPVILWATVDMTDRCSYSYWTTPDGSRIAYNNKLHCLLLVGYDDSYYYFNDPLKNVGEQKYVGYPKEKVEDAYELLGKQAVVITKKSGGGPGISESPDIPPEKSETITEPSEIDKKPSLPDEKVQDPIDLSTGAHVIDHTLMTIRGAQTISFSASYKSNQLTEGSLGTGWSHNFEKWLVDKGTEIQVYDSPTYYATYHQSSAGSGVYTTETLTKENYTVTKTASGYTVNCNYKSTEYYDTAGKLYKITSKSGFNTLLEYPDANTVKIIDEISGRYILLSKDAQGKITSITDNAGRTCTLGYTGSFLTSITDENGNILTYQYNDKGQVERGFDYTGTAYFTNTYDSIGRVISQEDALPGNVSSVIRYDDVSDPDYMLVSVTDRTLHTTVYKYNEAKQLVSKTDPCGIETKYAYDDAGNLIKKTDGLGNSVVNTYDANNNLTASIDKLGKKTEYTYDERNNLTEIRYPSGGTVTNSYDGKDRLMTNTDLRGVITKYTYNDQNLLEKVVYYAPNTAKTIRYAYEKGQAVSVTDPLGRETRNQYDAAGFLTASTDAQNNTPRYTYDQKGNVRTVTDAAGNVSFREYDGNGNVIKETDAAGNSTTYTYNGNLKMTSMTLPVGATILYEYDGEDRLTQTIYPDGTSDTNEYDAGGRVICQQDRDGNETSYVYDAANNIVQITDGIGGVTKKAYDAAGNLTKHTQVVEAYDENRFIPIVGSFQENDTTYTYDDNGRMIEMVNPVGGTTTYTYNDAGDLLSVTDPIGNTTENTYDPFGNLLTVTDPRGYTTAYSYDAAGNLLTVTNALGQITTNTYDSLNRLIATEDPGGHTTTYTYDALGRLATRTDARENTVQQYYDAIGNIIKITDHAGYVEFQAVYDEGGRATEVTDANGYKSFNVYDWSGNLTRQVDKLNQSCFYTYNSAGQMISAVDKAGGVSYATYDGAGNLTSMTGPGGYERNYIYNSAGQLYEREVTNESNEKNFYNALGLKTSYLDANRIIGRIEYDAAGRVTRDTCGDVIEYTYDENGNVLTATNSSGTVRREYDALNRVIKYTDIYDNVIEYEYDACGNLVKMKYPTGDVGVYTYDGNHNMLTSALEGSAYETTYTYDEKIRSRR